MKSNKLMVKENGGTILGLIIGLVVGLGVAVVVAMMITKTSSPFTNKLGMAKPDMPPIQLTDPNKPLYGHSYKEAPANQVATENPSANRDINADINADVNSVAESAEDTANYPEVESLPETVKLNPKPASNVVAKKEVAEKSAYYLQVAAFRNPSDAENARAKLALLGIESQVSEKNSEGDNLYRVRIGPFGSQDEMNSMRSRLVENSIDVAVIKTPK